MRGDAFSKSLKLDLRKILYREERADEFIRLVELLLSGSDAAEFKNNYLHRYKVTQGDPEHWDLKVINEHAAALVDVLENLHGDAEARLSNWQDMLNVRSVARQLLFSSGAILEQVSRRRGERNSFPEHDLARVRVIAKAFRQTLPHRPVSASEATVFHNVVAAIMAEKYHSVKKLISNAIEE